MLSSYAALTHKTYIKLLSMVNLYFEAILNKYRYPSTHGEVTTEDLFDIPMKELYLIETIVRRKLEKSRIGKHINNKYNPLATSLHKQLKVIRGVIAYREDR
jgi:hypothetical protein